MGGGESRGEGKEVVMESAPAVLGLLSEIPERLKVSSS